MTEAASASPAGPFVQSWFDKLITRRHVYEDGSFYMVGSSYKKVRVIKNGNICFHVISVSE